MTPQETVLLTAYVKACCPQQALGEYTPDAWHDLLGDLSLADCREAVAAVAKRQPFVAPAEIRAEVRRIREARLARTPLPAPPAELADEPGRYQRIVKANIERIAAGLDVSKALEGPPRGPLAGEPPEEWQQVREAIKPPVQLRPDPRDLAREQAAESRRQRGADTEEAS
jgi:hypothetical protein